MKKRLFVIFVIILSSFVSDCRSCSIQDTILIHKNTKEIIKVKLSSYFSKHNQKISDYNYIIFEGGVDRSEEDSPYKGTLADGIGFIKKNGEEIIVIHFPIKNSLTFLEAKETISHNKDTFIEHIEYANLKREIYDSTFMTCPPKTRPFKKLKF